MVEFLLFKPDDLEIQAMVITVAGSAVLSFDLRGCMIPLVLVQAGFNLRMTGKAFVVRDFIAEGMAACAIGDAFQLGMCRYKLARRYLGNRRKRNTQHGQAKDYGSYSPHGNSFVI